MKRQIIEFSIQKRKPKKNPKEYDIKTIEDIFNAVNEDNVNKFLKEFKMCLLSGFMVRSASKTGDVKFTSMKWIDD